MKLSSERDLEKQKDVLRNPGASGPDPVYWVFSEVGEESWMNVTVIQQGRYGAEYPKTYGHYHLDSAPDEKYHLIEGEGVLQLQKKHIEDGKLVPEKVDEVYLVRAKPGDEIIIKNHFGHSWSNVGNTPLISYDDWRSGHVPDEYRPIEQMHGMAYYLVEENGAVSAKANQNYAELPEPKWVTAEEFSRA